MKINHLSDTPVTYALIFEKNEEVMEALRQFVREHQFTASRFSAIGAFSDVTLGFFDPATKDYRENFVNEQVEVLSLLGDVASSDGGPAVHAHVVVGKSDGSAWGGHLLRATVWPTLELTIVETAAHLRRMHDPETGLALIGEGRGTGRDERSRVRKPVHRA